MTLQQRIKNDCKHIPRDRAGSPQNMFRECYMVCCKLTLNRNQVFGLAVALANIQWLNFVPQYDHEYFFGGKE